MRALGGDPGETLSSSETTQRLLSACETLRESASGFSQLGFREHAAEAHVECAAGQRLVGLGNPNCVIVLC